jgi:hypothetical protein
MKKKYIEIHLLLVLVLLLNSCEFEPKGVYEPSVNRNVDPPKIQTVDLNLNSDSIYLYTSMTVKFRFRSDNQDIKAVRFLIDGGEKGLFYNNNGEFFISSNELTEGRHTLVIEIYTYSGTGSIADKVGAEGFVASKSWDLVMDKNFNPTTTSDIRNGFLYITWTKFRATNFKEYVIYKCDYLYSEKEIGRSLIPEFVDRTYVGEDAHYRIKVKTTDDLELMVYYLNLPTDLPELHFTVDSLNHYAIKWGKSHYYNAVDTFLFLKGAFNDNYKRIGYTVNPEDTAYNITGFCFGDIVSLKLRLVPKKENVLYCPESYSGYETSTHTQLGFPFPYRRYFSDFSPVKEDEFAYISDLDTIIRYSVSQKCVIDKFGCHSSACDPCDIDNLRVSPSGKYLSARVGCWGSPFFTLSDNLDSYFTRNLDYLEGSSNYSPIPVSDSGTLLLHDYNGNLYLYDFNTSTVKGQYINNLVSPIGLKISVEGDYFFAKDDSLRLIRFNSSEFKTVWKTNKPDNVKLFEFASANPGLVIFWNGLVFSVKRCEDLSTVYEFPLNEDLQDVDSYNNEILTYVTGHLYVRSLIYGSLLNDIPVNFKPQGPQTLYLIGHTIIYPGYYGGIMYFCI